MRLLKIGSEGDDVKQLQKVLGLTADGIFGRLTKKAVKRYQLQNDLVVDGIVGKNTWQLMQVVKLTNDAIDEDTDINSQYYNTVFGSTIHKYYLSKDEYLQKRGKNEYLFLHHTAGGANPYACIDYWNRDSRGRVATEFVIGGQDCRNGNDEYDGNVLQAFPDDGYGWHLGKTGSGHMNRHSVGIEICSMGYLTEDYKTYVGKIADESQVRKLNEPFRGRRFWHKYSVKQVEELEKLIKYIAERDGINVRVGLKQWINKYGVTRAFEFQEDAYYGKVKGLLSHTNVRKGKMDIYPDPLIIEMIMSL